MTGATASIVRRSRLPAELRALPALLRVGFAQAIAYRAEFIVWVLAYTMPLIMLALWTAVAREGPVGRFDEKQFQAYFMTTLVVRVGTGAWVLWELNADIRFGVLSRRLLKPIHPLIGYACEQVAAMPMRMLLISPIVGATALWLGVDILTDDPVQLAILPLALLGAWAMTFLVMASIASLAFFWESSLSVFDLWLGFYIVLSGYLMPLELLPPAVRAATDWLPFRYMLSFPVENALGLLTREQALHALAVQWAWTAALVVILLTTWRAGLRRFAAYGG